MAVRSADVAGSNPRGTKRQGEKSFSDEEQPPKKGFMGRALGHIRGFAGSSSSSNLGTSTEKEALGQLAATNQPPTEIEAAEQTMAVVAQAVAEVGPAPTDPRELQVYTSKVVDRAATIRSQAKEAAKFANLNFNMNINQQDQAWIDKRNSFVEALKHPNQTPMEIFNENFTTAQMLYLFSPDGDGGNLLKIQEEHTKEYKEALGPTGRFRGVQDNLATKLTMLYFGLPIEPMTMNNVTMSGEEGDRTCYPDDHQETPRVQMIIYAEKPLEFLDKYGEGRSHGYPMLRSEFQSSTYHMPCH